MPGVCETVHVLIRHSPVSVQGQQLVTVAKGLTLQEDLYLAQSFAFPAPGGKLVADESLGEAALRGPVH